MPERLYFYFNHYGQDIVPVIKYFINYIIHLNNNEI